MPVDITLIFFVYGLAFFCLGLAMLFEAGRSPILAERRVLIPLVVFGLVHGSHEWIEMFLEKSYWIEVQNPFFWAWFRVVVLMVSFIALIIFGLEMLQPHTAFVGRGRVKWIIGLAVYVSLIILLGLICWGGQGNIAGCMDVIARYFLAVPGAAIAGIALYREANHSLQEGLPALGTPLRAAAIGFLVYAATQLVVSPKDFFPTNVINTENFITLTGVPIQFIRAAMAVLITLSLIRATQVTEEERKRQFIEVQRARMETLERLDEELKKKEAMRQDLLRHIVQAQEDERARIARELHDETSQILTAFSFHLAALQKVLGNDMRVEEPMQHLRNLNRRMASGIYRLMHDLRPAQLDDLGLVAALQYLCEIAEKQMGLLVRLEVLGNRRRLDPIVETAIFRIAQEAVTNTARHAEVHEAMMQMKFDSSTVRLRFSDQGVGFIEGELQNPGWGLKGIRERADSIGAKINIQSAPGEGTLVEIVLGLDENDFIDTKNDWENDRYGINSIDVGG